MLPFLYAALFLVVCYALITLLLHLGLRSQSPAAGNRPSVTVLIAARNEEAHLPACLESISRLQYPEDLLEIVIINDKSDDDTREIAEKFIARTSNATLLNIEDTIEGLEGKMNALCQGIESSRGEIILITDADCVVPPQWVYQFVSHFQPDVGLVGSMTLLTLLHKKESFFQRLQALDLIFLQGIAAATAEIRLPVTVLGNNFAFRRTAYEAVGGFRRLGFSLTEDMVLLKAIASSTQWRVRYPLNPAMAIYSAPVSSFAAFYQQRKRWVWGGTRVFWWGYVLMITSLLSHLSLFAILIPALFAYLPLALTGLIILVAADLSLVIRLLRRFFLLPLLLYFPVFELFFSFYSILFAPAVLFSRKVEWKGRNYE